MTAAIIAISILTIATFAPLFFRKPDSIIVEKKDNQMTGADVWNDLHQDLNVEKKYSKQFKAFKALSFIVGITFSLLLIDNYLPMDLTEDRVVEAGSYKTGGRRSYFVKYISLQNNYLTNYAYTPEANELLRIYETSIFGIQDTIASEKDGFEKKYTTDFNIYEFEILFCIIVLLAFPPITIKDNRICLVIMGINALLTIGTSIMLIGYLG